MSELMVKIIYPSSDAVFYITTRTPKEDAEWNELQAKTLMLAEQAFRTLKKADLLACVADGVTYEDGIPVWERRVAA